jgi:rod shape-determining protein MreD
MIRVIAVTTLIVAGSAFAQSTWFGAISILGVVPDLGMIILIWVAYRNGMVEGPVSGFLAGFVEDFLSAAPLGYNAFLKTIVASVASLLHGSFAIDRVFLPIAMGFTGTITKALSAEALALLFKGNLHSYSFTSRVFWIEAAYNAALAPIVFALLSLTKGLLITKQGRE